MMMNMMQKAMLDGMRLYYTAAFWSADIFQDQMEKTWAMIMEQNGKMRSEMDDIIAVWMLNVKKGRDELKLNLEKGLNAIEESVSGSNDGYWPLTGIYMNSPEMQMEAFRTWMGLWSPPADASGAETKKEKVKVQAAKGN